MPAVDRQIKGDALGALNAFPGLLALSKRSFVANAAKPSASSVRFNNGTASSAEVK